VSTGESATKMAPALVYPRVGCSGRGPSSVVGRGRAPNRPSFEAAGACGHARRASEHSRGWALFNAPQNRKGRLLRCTL
jgi:hypothetical protein